MINSAEFCNDGGWLNVRMYSFLRSVSSGLTVCLFERHRASYACLCLSISFLWECWAAPMSRLWNLLVISFHCRTIKFGPSQTAWDCVINSSAQWVQICHTHTDQWFHQKVIVGHHQYWIYTNAWQLKQWVGSLPLKGFFFLFLNMHVMYQ